VGSNEGAAAVAAVEGAPASEAAVVTAAVVSAAAVTAVAFVASEAAKGRGNGAMARGDAEAAWAHYAEALSHDPANLAARNNRALCRLKSGSFAGAQEDCDWVLAAEPGNGKALFRRAAAREAQGFLGGAVADLTETLRFDPRNAAAASRLAEVRAKMQGNVAAREASSATKAKKATKTPATSLAPPVAAPAPPAAATPPAKKASQITVVDDADPSPAKTPPKAPATARSPTAAAVSASAAAAVASPPAGAVRRITVVSPVPTEAPKTMTELERHWRELKGEPSAVAAYLRAFKVSTFKKVFKSSTNPDIVPGILMACATELGRDGSALFDLKACCSSLKGLAKTDGFHMTLMLLSPVDKAHATKALARLEAAPKYAADAAELKVAFKL
jgi:tetratricopeptide (TPR) repeat protein